MLHLSKETFQPWQMSILLATIVMVWEDSGLTGSIYVVIHEALYFGEQLKDSLLCPNQLRVAGVIVEDTLHQL